MHRSGLLQIDFLEPNQFFYGTTVELADHVVLFDDGSVWNELQNSRGCSTDHGSTASVDGKPLDFALNDGVVRTPDFSGCID